MTTQKKIDLVSEITGKLTKAKSVILTQYRGLTHKQLEDIKKSIKTAEADFIVVKNSLLSKALTGFRPELKKEDLEKKISGPTAVLFAYQDEVQPLKLLMKSIKLFTLPVIKFGYLGKQEISEEEVNKLAKLPTRDVILSQLLGGLKAPIYGLHRSLSWNMQKLVMALSAVNAKK